LSCYILLTQNNLFCARKIFRNLKWLLAQKYCLSKVPQLINVRYHRISKISWMACLTCCYRCLNVVLGSYRRLVSQGVSIFPPRGGEGSPRSSFQSLPSPQIILRSGSCKFHHTRLIGFDEILNFVFSIICSVRSSNFPYNLSLELFLSKVQHIIVRQCHCFSVYAISLLLNVYQICLPYWYVIVVFESSKSSRVSRKANACSGTVQWNVDWFFSPAE